MGQPSQVETLSQPVCWTSGRQHPPSTVQQDLTKLDTATQQPNMAILYVGRVLAASKQTRSHLSGLDVEEAAQASAPVTKTSFWKHSRAYMLAVAAYMG